MIQKLNNPSCPECGTRTQKFGFITTRQGRKQRYHCTSCGLTFTIKKVQ